MKPTEEITDLARQIQERQHSDNAEAFILFLGRGCADAAGVPWNATIARKVLADLDDPTYRPDPSVQDDSIWEQYFYGYLSGLSNVQRYRVLQPFFKSIPVPNFYQDLATLIKAGYFHHILTTNIDTLLEQAMNGAGLLTGKDYQVISLGSRKEMSEQEIWTNWNEAGSKRLEPVSVLKLHGDLEQSDPALGADEIRKALEMHRRTVQVELSGELVIVGYQFESPPVSKWLGRMPGVLWWVSEAPPDETQIASIEENRPVKHIHGENAAPQSFFGNLVYLLMKPQIEISMQVGTVEQGRTVLDYEFESLGEVTSPGETPPSDTYSDSEYLRGQIRRNQQLLANLKQNLIPGERNVQLETQVDYQQRTIAELEDKLRNLEGNRQRVLELMQRVSEASQKASDDPSVAAFAQSQYEAASFAYTRTPPNQIIISAAIDAAVVLAERLGPGIVTPEVVQELASFAPSPMARGV